MFWYIIVWHDAATCNCVEYEKVTNAPLRIGTRGSPLALWQAEHVAARLRSHGRDVQLVVIQTKGDRVQNVPLAQLGGDGLFTKAIQDAVRAGRADVAVHSLKDLPTVPVAGLTLAAVPSRGPVGDAFVSSRFARFDELPQGASVATGSQRRKALLLNRRPDLLLHDLRGNIETRLRKLEVQGLDAIILAEAGLSRLDLSHVITEVLDSAWMVPAVGQGALGLECRSDDAETLRLLRHLDDRDTHAAVTAERSFLLAMGGGCQIPLGALGIVSGETLNLRGVLLSPDGRERREGRVQGLVDGALKLGQTLAEIVRT